MAGLGLIGLAVVLIVILGACVYGTVRAIEVSRK